MRTRPLSPNPPIARRLDWRADPRAILRGWPPARSLAVLWSSKALGPAAAQWSRWTVLAAPVGTLRVAPAPGGSECGELCMTIHGRAGPNSLRSEHADPLDLLAAAVRATARPDDGPASPDQPPFAGGWIAVLGYELGRSIEPRAGHGRGTSRVSVWPRVLLHRCPAAYVHDRLTGRWWVVGSPDDAAELPGESELLARHALPEPAFAFGGPGDTAGSAAREHYQRGVARVVEYIRAGDVFQANLSHELRGAFAGSMRTCFGAMIDRVSPWFGAYIEDVADRDHRAAIASVSPELFLGFDPATRTVTTRPIKGTRRGDDRPNALSESPKDHAELAMIVDLMRNDLGRVCEFGTVRVPEARIIEHHAAGPTASGVLHGVATVQGRLRDGLVLGDLLRATFPGGSITGAPKIRAMQIIDELEPHARGAYTGSIGYISDGGHACFNIAIRTALLSGRAANPGPGEAADLATVEAGAGAWSYAAGAGIVADSIPAAEWDETLAKAEPILGLGAAQREHPCPTPAIA